MTFEISLISVVYKQHVLTVLHQLPRSPSKDEKSKKAKKSPAWPIEIWNMKFAFLLSVCEWVSQWVSEFSFHRAASAAKKKLDQKIIKKKIWTWISFDQKIFGPKTSGPKIFLFLFSPQAFFDQNFLWPKIVFDPKYFGPKLYQSCQSMKITMIHQ